MSPRFPPATADRAQRRAGAVRPLFATLFVLALILAFVLALRPAPEMLPSINHFDKVQHAIAFMLISLLGFAAWPRRAVMIVAVMLGYAAAMELAQSFTAYRQGDYLDWLADAAGIAAAFGLRRLLPGSRRVEPSAPLSSSATISR